MRFQQIGHDERGFTIVEVLVAVTLLAIPFLALAGSVAFATRQIMVDMHDLDAAAIVQHRIEQTSASPCISQAGTDSVNGVLVQWHTTGNATHASGTAVSTHHTRRGDRTEHYEFTGGCR